MADLTPEDFRVLRILSKRSCHDTEDEPIHQLSRLISMGLARIEGHEFLRWAGRRHKVREVMITDAGRAALGDSDDQ